ncbi:hypothetical protein Bca101_010932 [Brassica carinata]
MPERVVLLRGSSETIVSAEEFGFLKEPCDRYANTVQCYIPNSVYTTHGGLFQSSSRVHEDSTLLLGSLEELDKVDKSQVRENDDGNITLNPVLWPCPWMADGLSEMIIRSQECPDVRSDREDMGNMLCGYSVDHEMNLTNGDSKIDRKQYCLGYSSTLKLQVTALDNNLTSKFFKSDPSLRNIGVH